MPIITNGGPTGASKRKRRSRKGKRGDRRQDFWVNQTIIEEAYLAYFKEHKRSPSARKLAEITGFNRNTIMAHTRDLDLDRMVRTMPSRTLVAGIIRRLTEKVYSNPGGPDTKMVLQLYGFKFETEMPGQGLAKTYKAYAGFDPDAV